MMLDTGLWMLGFWGSFFLSGIEHPASSIAQPFPLPSV
jgi:hypothetical protein